MLGLSFLVVAEANMTKTRVLLLFGGQSAEHEVSVISARSVFAAIDRNRYDPILVGIARDGRWLLAEQNTAVLEDDAVGAQLLPEVSLARRGSELVVKDYAGESEGVPFDVVFPLLHGPFGEDGTIQGLLELAGAAYVGAGVTASAVAMDKAFSKLVFAASGLAQAPYQVIRRDRWRTDVDGVVAEIEERFDYPMFVKPANMGSSIGVSKVTNTDALRQGLSIAAEFDVKLLIEVAFNDCHEVECSVLGNQTPSTSVVGEIVPGGDFYDYQTKYLDDCSQLIVPASIDSEATERVQRMSIAAFKAIDGAGLARVDFFVRRSDGEVFINEINTMPGFTPISMYPMLWQASGLTYAELIDQLIGFALARRAQRKGLRQAP